MSAAAIFLDKDGTLLDDVPLSVDPDAMKLAPGAREALGIFAGVGAPIFVISNQGGVARGRFEIGALDDVEARLHEPWPHAARRYLVCTGVRMTRRARSLRTTAPAIAASPRRACCCVPRASTTWRLNEAGSSATSSTMSKPADVQVAARFSSTMATKPSGAADRCASRPWSRRTCIARRSSYVNRWRIARRRDERQIDVSHARSTRTRAGSHACARVGQRRLARPLHPARQSGRRADDDAGHPRIAVRCAATASHAARLALQARPRTSSRRYGRRNRIRRALGQQGRAASIPQRPRDARAPRRRQLRCRRDFHRLQSEPVARCDAVPSVGHSRVLPIAARTRRLADRLGRGNRNRSRAPVTKWSDSLRSSHTWALKRGSADAFDVSPPDARGGARLARPRHRRRCALLRHPPRCDALRRARYPIERFARSRRAREPHRPSHLRDRRPRRSRAHRVVAARAHLERHLDLAGALDLGEMAALIEVRALLVSNNSGPGTSRALGTPVVDLYALTNPQHMPWRTPNRVLSRDVPCR